MRADGTDGTNGQEPIDVAHLDRATFGDRALALEVLTLFETQAARLLGEIGAAESPTARREAAHALKGAARGIGAGEVAKAAAAIEARSGKILPPAELARLTSSVQEARAAIARLRARR